MGRLDQNTQYASNKAATDLSEETKGMDGVTATSPKKFVSFITYSTKISSNQISEQ